MNEYPHKKLQENHVFSEQKNIPFWFRAILARLRFLIAFGLLFLLISSWDQLLSVWERLTSLPQTETAISSDTEFFCPMDPGVSSDWPEKCPVCNMTLVKRKRGEMPVLPDGSISRMQYSPDRLWLGGIQTVAAVEEPLIRTLSLKGVFENTGEPTVISQVFNRDLPWLTPESNVLIEPETGSSFYPAWQVLGMNLEPAQHPSFRSLRVRIDIGSGSAAPSGSPVVLKVTTPVECLEPFKSLPSFPPELVAGEARTVFQCMDHRDVVSLTAGRCPRDQQDLMRRPLTIRQRLRWWCPMHPGVTADAAGGACEPCGGMKLIPHIIGYRAPGMVLAVPASAVIQDGDKSMVYVDRGGGVFEGRLVTVGPRCGDFVPVATGLEPGDKVAAKGAFLLDAETQLNPALAGVYFGAAGRSVPTTNPEGPTQLSKEQQALLNLSEADQTLAERQNICPVTKKRLGSMGVPPRLEINGQIIFVCCEGCTDALNSQPEKYLSKLPVSGSKKPQGKEPMR